MSEWSQVIWNENEFHFIYLFSSSASSSSCAVVVACFQYNFVFGHVLYAHTHTHKRTSRLLISTLYVQYTLTLYFTFIYSCIWGRLMHCNIILFFVYFLKSKSRWLHVPSSFAFLFNFYYLVVAVAVAVSTVVVRRMGLYKPLLNIIYKYHMQNVWSCICEPYLCTFQGLNMCCCCCCFFAFCRLIDSSNVCTFSRSYLPDPCRMSLCLLCQWHCTTPLRLMCVFCEKLFIFQRNITLLIKIEVYISIFEASVEIKTKKKYFK